MAGHVRSGKCPVAEVRNPLAGLLYAQLEVVHVAAGRDDPRRCVTAVDGVRSVDVIIVVCLVCGSSGPSTFIANPITKAAMQAKEWDCLLPATLNFAGI